MYKNHTPAFDAEISLHEVIGSTHTLAGVMKALNPRTERALECPIFVVGSPRSGTTVLGRCLGAHTACATAEESLVLLPLWRMYADLYAGGVPSGVRHLSEYTTEDELVATLGAVSDRLFSGLLERTGAQRYIDHTPWYGAIVPFVRALYPDARFVHLVRDGRQVVRSLSDSYEKGFLWAGHDHATRCRIWTNMVRVTRDGLAQQDSSSIELLYANLCSDPTSTLESASKFLRLEFENQMLEPLTRQHAGSTAKSTYGSARLAERFTPSGWPTDWDIEMCDVFNSEAGALMEELFGQDWSKSPQ